MKISHNGILSYSVICNVQEKQAANYQNFSLLHLSNIVDMNYKYFKNKIHKLFCLDMISLFLTHSNFTVVFRCAEFSTRHFNSMVPPVCTLSDNGDTLADGSSRTVRDMLTVTAIPNR